MKREFIETKKGYLSQEQSKLLRGAYESWKRSTDYELWHVYDNFSDNKVRALDYCRELQYCLDGRRLRIVSHNCMVFTFGYTNYKGFWYITKCNDYFISWEDIRKYEETV